MIAAVGHSEDLDSRDAIGEALDACVATLGGATPRAGLAFSYADRKAMLGTRLAGKIDLLNEGLGGTIPFIGFYANGELCRLPCQQRTHAHGFTFVTVLLGED